MKILAIEKEMKDVDWNNLGDLLKDEAQHVFHLYLSNSLREIYFTEKDTLQATMLTNLNDYKDIRQDTKFEKRYIHDRQLCAIPQWNLKDDNFWGE